MNVIPSFTTAFYKYKFLLDISDVSNSDIVYRGILKTKKYGDVYIDFLFDDDAFINFPHALIGFNSQNKFRPYHFPHLDETYCLCYHDGSYVFDRYAPESMVYFCIENVKKVLNETIEDDMTEILKEFPSYWSSTRTKYYSYLVPNDYIAYFKDNKIVSPINLALINNEKKNEIPIFKLSNTPSIENIEWPLENYNSLKKWIVSSAPNVEQEIQKYIKNMICDKYHKIMIILYLEDIDIYIGLSIEYRNSNYNLKMKTKFRLETVNSIFNGNHIFHRFNISNNNAAKIIYSNIPIDSYTFINKKILLIGAGTIGSNLGNILVKNGASIGKDAKLTIIDPDIYEPYNYSRHFLGIRYAGCNKAIAIKSELENAFPFAKIDAIDKEIQEIEIENYNIIIDSTGEESLTQWLNEKIKTNKLEVIFISAWIQGHGVAAECLIITNNNEACHECFKRSEYKINNNNDTELLLRDSCNSIYIPFPISASMYVALLVISILNKWHINNTTKTTFFRQILNPIGEIMEIEIVKNEECPLCGKKY